MQKRLTFGWSPEDYGVVGSDGKIFTEGGLVQLIFCGIWCCLLQSLCRMSRDLQIHPHHSFLGYFLWLLLSFICRVISWCWGVCLRLTWQMMLFEREMIQCFWFDNNRMINPCRALYSIMLHICWVCRFCGCCRGCFCGCCRGCCDL